jgi:hypothetical protein
MSRGEDKKNEAVDGWTGRGAGGKRGEICLIEQMLVKLAVSPYSHTGALTLRPALEISPLFLDAGVTMRLTMPRSAGRRENVLRETRTRSTSPRNTRINLFPARDIRNGKSR